MNVTMQGLSEAEALTRLAVHGPNAMPEARPTALAVRVIAQFKSPLIYILLLALCLDVGLWIHEGAGQTPFEAIAIGLIPGDGPPQ
ncbi:MAG TPA: cation-transporting P-type ATPase [Hyphomicrobiaceae bacterium]|jgi:Ca2+-transporting ATPase|nr:cation-transporting P-type ATPase [Hyphomicrobiaceae bacterium]